MYLVLIFTLGRIWVVDKILMDLILREQPKAIILGKNVFTQLQLDFFSLY